MPDVSPLAPGDPGSVAGYRLTGRLGEGGQGTVYLAQGPGGERVAIKLLHSVFGGDPTARARFVREVATAQRVASFCTARVLAADVDGDVPYLVSEYVDGPSLQELVERDGPMSGTDLERLAVGTVTALVAIHQAGIVHRDFKPSNVLLSQTGPRVVDFGIAKALDVTSNLTSQAIGTPAYMAPEQLAEAVVGPPADMFAWACTMAYAANASPPFGNDTVPAVIARILREEPNITGLDGPLRDIVVRCLNKNPAARPTASDVLTRLLGGPGTAMPEPAAQTDAPSSPATVGDHQPWAAQPWGGAPQMSGPPTMVPPTAPLPPPGGPMSPGGPFYLPQPVPAPASQTQRTVLIVCAAVVAVVLLAGAGVLVATNGSKKPTPARSSPLAATSHGVGVVTPTAPTPTAPSPSAPSPSDSGPKVRTPVDLNKVLLKDFEGFTPVLKRTVDCAEAVGDAIKKVLPQHPCKAPVTEALYLNKAQTIKVTLAILTFTDETEAKAVEAAGKTSKDFPIQLYPLPKGSNLPRVTAKSITGWTYHAANYQYLVYAESYHADGHDAGPAGGEVDRAAHDLGAETANMIIWS